jgi:hypothetical protein
VALFSGCVASEIELLHLSVFPILRIMLKYGTDKGHVCEINNCQEMYIIVLWLNPLVPEVNYTSCTV